MTAADLAQHYSADELLAALCTKMDPAGAVAAVRAIAPFLSEEDMAARTRRLANERSARSYAKKAGKSHAEPSDSHGNQRQNYSLNASSPASDSHAEPSETGGNSDGLGSVGKEERFQTSKEETPPPASTPTHVRPPTVEEVLYLLTHSVFPIPPAERAEFAQAYVDHRSRLDPPWHLPATNDRPPQKINLAEWRADCRRFASNWRNVEQDRAFKRQQGGANGHHAARPRAEPDTTPLTVDAALWTTFVTSPDHPEYRSLASQSTPKSEADISPGALPDWKNFKRRNKTQK